MPLFIEFLLLENQRQNCNRSSEAANWMVSPNALQRVLHIIKPPENGTGFHEAKHWTSSDCESQAGVCRYNSAGEAINKGFENHLNFQHEARVFTSQEISSPHRTKP